MVTSRNRRLTHEGVGLRVQERRRRVLLDPAQDLVPPARELVPGQDGSVEQRSPSPDRSTWPTLLDPLHDQLWTRPEGEGSWSEAEKSMSKCPGAAPLHVGRKVELHQLDPYTHLPELLLNQQSHLSRGSSSCWEPAVEARAAGPRAPARRRRPGPPTRETRADVSRSGAVLARLAAARRAGSRAVPRSARRAPLPYAPSTAFTRRRRSSASVSARRTSTSARIGWGCVGCSGIRAG